MNVRQRHALIGALFVGLAIAAALLCSRFLDQSAPTHVHQVAECVADAAKCSGANVRLGGAYVPGSQAWGHAGCATELDLQTFGDAGKGHIRVCAHTSQPAFDTYCSDARLVFYAQHGFLHIIAEGSLKEGQFEARNVFVPSCDYRWYQWAYGSPDEISARERARAGAGPSSGASR